MEQYNDIPVQWHGQFLCVKPILGSCWGNNPLNTVKAASISGVLSVELSFNNDIVGIGKHIGNNSGQRGGIIVAKIRYGLPNFVVQIWLELIRLCCFHWPNESTNVFTLVCKEQYAAFTG